MREPLSTLLQRRSVLSLVQGTRTPTILASTSAAVPGKDAVNQRLPILESRLLDVTLLAEHLALRQLSDTAFLAPRPELVIDLRVSIDVIDLKAMSAAACARPVCLQPCATTLLNPCELIGTLLRPILVRHRSL